jgi:hypothetical protein
MASTRYGVMRRAQVEAFNVGDTAPGPGHSSPDDQGEAVQGAAAMSLSAWEQQALDSIKDTLATSDPGLAGLLTAFSRLASGEEMPAREAIRAARRPRRQRRHRAGQVSRHVRRAREILGSRRPALLLWLAITAVLITVALVLNSGNAPAACPYSWAMDCTNSAPAHGSPAGAGATTAVQEPPYANRSGGG